LILTPLGIEVVHATKALVHRDDRGHLVRLFDEKIFADADWTQESFSFTERRGTLRGLHVTQSRANMERTRKWQRMDALTANNTKRGFT
jgi:dTDP-4-dehydrorhamnose 3,5-epimerase-like enzyme